MKRFLSVLLALMIAAACAGGAAAESPAGNVYTLNIRTRLDREQIASLSGSGMTEEENRQLDMIADVVNVLRLDCVTDGNVFRIALLAEDETLADFQGMTDEAGGVHLFSSLLGENEILIPDSLVRKIADAALAAAKPTILELKAALEKINPEKAVLDLAFALVKFFGTIETAKGETETGTFEIDGMAFISRTPVNITFEDILVLAMSGLKDLAASDSFSPVIRVFDRENTLPARLDEGMEKIKNLPEEQKIELRNFAIYSDGVGGLCYAGDLFQAGNEGNGGKEMNIRFSFGFQNSQFRANIVLEQKDGVRMQYTAYAGLEKAGGPETAEARGAGTVIAAGSATEVEEKGKTLRSVTSYTMDTESCHTESAMFVNKADNPLISMTADLKKGGEISPPVRGEKARVYDLEKILEGRDRVALLSLAFAGYGHCMDALDTLSRHLPEESSRTLNKLITDTVKFP